MLDRDYRDIVAGLLLTATGSAAAAYAFTHYAMGTIKRMGPGMMPVSLGIILAVFGLAIAIPALVRKGAKVDIAIRPFVVVTLSILAFALLIESAGLLPSVFATVVIATFAERTVSIVNALILGAALALLTWAIFILGLGLPMAAIRWPF